MKKFYQTKKEQLKTKKRFIKAAGKGTNSLATIITRLLFYHNEVAPNKSSLIPFIVN
ncbi:hypothetical protein KM900_02830 [Bacillus subtilis]|uniref:hypothetical protein n=1 Tax=Bacillus subtilis TaxID=1423 RepID=UPI001C246063|nr:hypothetical protein [Bacillus subtilis]MBU8569520.1 hypothetical protein [Bacillus subtilis]MBU8622337.1 hypothetical protein [Bacillus subtilis]